MEFTIKEIDDPQLDLSSEGIVILPHNYKEDEKHEYHSTTISFYKYSRDKLDIRYLSKPELLIEQRSGEWFGPLLFISSAALLQNPELISIVCSVIANYITDYFKGKEKPNIRLTFVIEETKTSKTTKLSYEGGIEGLDKLPESINEIVRKSINNE